MEIYRRTFTVEAIDKDKKIFDKVSKLYLASEHHRLTIDYHSLLFKPKAGDAIEIVLYSGILVESEVPSRYEYVMQGHCYENTCVGGKRTVKVSFGGLLMELVVVDCDIGLSADCHDVGIALRIM